MTSNIYQFVSVFLVIAGLLALSLSIKPATSLCKRCKSAWHWWHVLRYLLYGFLGAYFLSIAAFILLPASNTLMIGGSVILCAGGLFVWIVLQQSLKAVKRSNILELNAKHDLIHDRISGLPNKFALRDRFKELKLIEKHYFITVRMLKYHEIAEVLGGKRDTELQCFVGERINSLKKFKFEIFDLGSCNYAILVPVENNESQVVALIQETLPGSFETRSSRIQLDCCIGIAQFPEHGDTLDTVLLHASMAASKASINEQSFYCYDSELGQEMEERLSLTEMLRDAIEGNELELHYQPIFSGISGNVRSVEALARWPLKDGSFIPPDKFVAIAEQERIVHLLTEWVIDSALKQMNQWNQQGLNFRMNINLSSHDLAQEHFLQYLEECRRNWDVQAENLVLELTESAVMIDADKSIRVMNQLVKCGYKLAIDDFGTGYSSMSRLKELPINHIKIDKEFVSEIETSEQDWPIVQATNSLAKAFGCKVTAEGVESEDAAIQLVKMGCDYLQGFHFSKPLPSGAATELLYNNYHGGTSRLHQAA